MIDAVRKEWLIGLESYGIKAQIKVKHYFMKNSLFILVILVVISIAIYVAFVATRKEQLNMKQNDNAEENNFSLFDRK